MALLVLEALCTSSMSCAGSGGLGRTIGTVGAVAA